MSVTNINAGRRASQQYEQGFIDGIDHVLDMLLDEVDSPYVYKNRHKGIAHCVDMAEGVLGYWQEQKDLGYPDL